MGKVFKQSTWSPHELAVDTNSSDYKFAGCCFHVTVMSHFWIGCWRATKVAFVQQCQKITSLVIIQWTCAAHAEAYYLPAKGSAVYLVEYSWYCPLLAPTPWPNNQGKSAWHNCSDFMMCCSKNSLLLFIAKASSSFRAMQGLTLRMWPRMSSIPLVGKFYHTLHIPQTSCELIVTFLITVQSYAQPKISKLRGIGNGME
jgi:hypothetical protein